MICQIAINDILENLSHQDVYLYSLFALLTLSYRILSKHNKLIKKVASYLFHQWIKLKTLSTKISDEDNINVKDKFILDLTFKASEDKNTTSIKFDILVRSAIIHRSILFVYKGDMAKLNINEVLNIYTIKVFDIKYTPINFNDNVYTLINVVYLGRKLILNSSSNCVLVF